ncbi:MAG: TIGR02186 family protein [Hyphomicrobiales bacterium]
MGNLIRGLIALLLFLPAPVTAQELVTSLSKYLISIESTFTGAELLLFGAVEGRQLDRQTDVAIVVRGPEDDIIVRRKARVSGIWVNFDYANIAAVPGYYAVVSTRPLEQIAAPEVLQRHGIGMANLHFPMAQSAGADAEPYREALIRLRTREDLYQSDSNGVVFVGNTLFRATVKMPANVPNGVFSASVYLFQDGNLIHAQTTPLYVSKAGFERFIYDLANRQPLTYGILAVLIALFAGWSASIAFRRS